MSGGVVGNYQQRPHSLYNYGTCITFPSFGKHITTLW